MKRRKFLALAGMGTAILAVPTIGFSSTTFFKEAFSTIITRELHFLKLDQEGVMLFADDYMKYIDTLSFAKGQKLRLKIDAEYLIPGSIGKEKVSDIISRYLLASDYFNNGMDASRIVKYIGLSDPYKRPCTNPFSHLYYPPANQMS